MKKIISLSLALLFFVLQNNTLIHAMSTEDAPISKGDPLTTEYLRNIDATFRAQNRRVDTSKHAPGQWSNHGSYIEDEVFARDKFESIPVDPKSDDFRKIQVLNIPRLMGKKLDDNFIKNMIGGS